MSEGACQQCWVDCEKWENHPEVNLFDLSNPEESSRSRVPDITSSSMLTLGEGWGVLERFEGVVFRWVENDAEIIMHPKAQPASVVLEVEPGPGLGGKDLDLMVLDSAGVKIDSRTLQGRDFATFVLPDGRRTPQRYRLHTEGGGHRIATDPRILNFRVFSLRVAESPTP